MEPSPQAIVFISKLLPPMTRAISLFIPGRDAQIAWRNAKNNAEIMELVANIGKKLPPAGAQVSLPELVRTCYSLGPFPALWAIEGLGHYYGDGFYARKEIPENLLTAPATETLPAASLTMLHAGIGMAFAKSNLQTVNAKSSPADVRKAVQNIVTLCKNSSRPGYTGAAVESLGLVSRWLHDLPTLKVVDEQLAAIAPDLLGYLWHGAGRAVYFSPQNFVPGIHTPWRAVEMCRTEAPHELGRRNMVAGLAWAITLVNMRYPLIMETVLKYHGEEFLRDDAFSSGVMSSIIMRYDITPDDPHIDLFLKYRPAGSDAKLVGLWDRLIKGPCERAMQVSYPVLKKYNRLEEVFHYQDLDALVQSLQEVPANRRR